LHRDDFQHKLNSLHQTLSKWQRADKTVLLLLTSAIKQMRYIRFNGRA